MVDRDRQITLSPLGSPASKSGHRAAQKAQDGAADRHSSARSKNDLSDTGQNEPLTALYQEYAEELSNGIRSRYGDGPPDPDDVAQDAFRRVFERADVSKIVNLKAFLWRTARNLVIDAKRSDQTRSKFDFEVEQLFFPLKGDTSTPETVIIAREQLAAINGLLRRMPEKRRWALILYRLDGLTLTEIGRRLGISRTAVTKHISKAEMQINALFLEEGED